MLFQWDVTHDDIEGIVTTFWASQEDTEVSQEFANNLVIGTVAHVEEIDVLITRHAENWRLDRMALVDRNLLRLASFEFLWEPQTPRSAVINEAIEIARRFSSQESPQFINGILDSIRKEVEAKETDGRSI